MRTEYSLDIRSLEVNNVCGIEKAGLKTRTVYVTSELRIDGLHRFGVKFIHSTLGRLKKGLLSVFDPQPSQEQFIRENTPHMSEKISNFQKFRNNIHRFDFMTVQLVRNLKLKCTWKIRFYIVYINIDEEGSSHGFGSFQFSLKPRMYNQ